MLCGTTLCINRDGIDQWGLMHVGIFSVQGINEENWTNYLRACNMDPCLQLSFDQWCKNIEGVLQEGETFKEGETLYMYAMLLSNWHGMMPAENLNMMNVIDSHGGVFLVNLCKASRTENRITFKEIHLMLMCDDLENTHPEHLGMTLTTINQQRDENSDIIMDKATVYGAT